MVYLFIGEDEPAKRERIRSLKKQLLQGASEDFNYELLHPQELTLPILREAFGRLPVSASQRLLVIKDILRLKDRLLECLSGLLESGLPDYLTLVLDAAAMPAEETPPFKKILKSAKVVNFKAAPSLNAFGLGRAVSRKDASLALNILAELFKNGQKPEMILGALRYQLMNNAAYSLAEKTKKAGLLLETDLIIKTGRLKPAFALEALLVRLCL